MRAREFFHIAHPAKPMTLTLSRRRLLKSLALIAIVGIAFIIVLIMRAEPAYTHPFFESDAAGRPLVIAHRGGAGLRPENTLAAFAYADEIGADVLEMDVRRTADNQLVVIHDATLDRTTTGSGAVNTLTVAEIKRLDAAFRFSPTGAKVVVSNERYFPFRGKGISVPTIEEVFESFPTKRILIEIKKSEPVWVAEKLCATIRRHDRTRTTLVASVNHATLTLFRARCAEVATSASAYEARNFLALRFVHLTAAYSPAFHALQVPPALGNLPIITREFVRAAHARNLVVHPWTINDEQEMRRLLDTGVDGIITDRPDILIQLMRNHG